MNQDLKVENIDLIVKVLERPSIFSVQKVDFFFCFSMVTKQQGMTQL